MAGLTIHLLGPFDVAIDGSPVVAFELDRVRALLAYLAVEPGRPHLRESLACLLWPDASTDSARANLRQAIYKLRIALGEQGHPRFLQVSPSFIQLQATEDTWVDANIFSTLVRSARQHRHARLNECDVCLANLRAAIDLYRGDFLSGLALPDSLPYQEWAAVRQAELRDYVLSALAQLGRATWERGAYEEADDLARRRLALEPWSEEAHRMRMRVLAATDRRSAALHQFDLCRRILLAELGVEPDAATQALYRQIRESHGLRSGATVSVPEARPPEHDPVRDRIPSEEHGPVAQPCQQPSVLPHPTLAGRERELAWLDARLTQMLERHGQVALVTGSPGSGKTTLLCHFASRALDADPELVAAGAHFNMMGDLDGFSTFVEILRLIAADAAANRGSVATTPEHGRRAQAALPDFVAALAAEGPDLVDLLAGRESGGTGKGESAASLSADPLFQALLAGRPRPTTRPPQATLFDQFVRTLLTYARAHPLVIVLDDLHWMGQDGAALLSYLASHLAGSRILLLGSYRSGLWTGDPADCAPVAGVLEELRARPGDIELDLDEADGRGFVEAYLGTLEEPVDPDLQDAIFARTQGHPLFAIELACMLGDNSARLAPRLADGAEREFILDRLPGRLEAVLAERLAGLPVDWQRTLEIASIQGSTFAAEVVAAVQGANPDDIIDRLSGPLAGRYRLIDADRVERGNGWRLTLYRFRNAFVRDLLYGRLDRVQKSRWHEATAEAIEGLLQLDRDRMLGKLARHHRLAGNAAVAANYLEQAGRYALASSAYREAHQYLIEALEVLRSLDESEERSKQELRLHFALDRTLRLDVAWDAQERGLGVHRACELSEQSGEADAQIQALYLRADLYISRGETPEAIAVGQQMLAIAAETQKPAHLALARVALGDACWFAGDYRRTCKYLEPAIEYFEAHPADTDPHTAAFGHAVVDHCWCALSYEALGERALASRHAEAALACAGTSPESRIFAIVFAGCLLRWLREDEYGAALAVDELAGAAKGHRLPASLSSWVELWQGWRQARDGSARGVLRMEEESIAWKSPPAEFGRPLRALLLAQGYRSLGLAEEALEVIQKGIQACPPSGPYTLEPELWRVKGELVLARSLGSPGAPGIADSSEAFACFGKAQALARACGAVLLEQRAARSLGTPRGTTRATPANTPKEGMQPLA